LTPLDVDLIKIKAKLLHRKIRTSK